MCISTLGCLHRVSLSTQRAVSCALARCSGQGVPVQNDELGEIDINHRNPCAAVGTLDTRGKGDVGRRHHEAREKMQCPARPDLLDDFHIVKGVAILLEIKGRVVLQFPPHWHLATRKHHLSARACGLCLAEENTACLHDHRHVVHAAEIDFQHRSPSASACSFGNRCRDARFLYFLRFWCFRGL